MIHDFQEHFSIFRDFAGVTSLGLVTPGPSRRFACHVFAASSSSQQQTETEQTNSTGGASSPSIGLTGSGGASVNTGTRLDLSGNSQVQTFDPQVADSAFAAIVNTVQQAISAVTGAAQATTTANANSAQQQSNLVNSVLSADQATAANSASQGQTNNNATIVQVVIAAIVAFAIWVIWGRK